MSARPIPSRPVRVLALVGLLAGCDLNAGPAEVTQEQGALVATRYPAGAVLDSPALLQSKQVAYSGGGALTAALPTAVDLTPKLAPVGNQGGEGSCTAWAVGYALKTAQEVTEMKWPAHADDHTFSPSWIYNQINGGVDRGSRISDAMALLVNKGADTISSFPYVDGQFTLQPNADSMARAAHYKAQSWNTIAITATNIKTTLAGGNPVVVGFNLLPDFDAMNGSTNTVYDTDQGTRAAFTLTCNNTAASIAGCQGVCNGAGKCGSCNTMTGVCSVPACTTPPCSRGGHAVAIVGYDDTSQTFRFVNSWSATWNGNGYGGLSYGFITNSNLALGAYVLVDKANVPGLIDSTTSWVASSSVRL